MKNMRLLTLSVVSVTLLLVAVRTVRAQDIVKVAPKNCKVLLDNDQVRVIRVVQKPGEKIEMHSHPAYILYVLTSGKSKFTSDRVRVRSDEKKARI